MSHMLKFPEIKIVFYCPPNLLSHAWWFLIEYKLNAWPNGHSKRMLLFIISIDCRSYVCILSKAFSNGKILWFVITCVCVDVLQHVDTQHKDIFLSCVHAAVMPSYEFFMYTFSHRLTFDKFKSLLIFFSVRSFFFFVRFAIIIK